MNVDDPVRIQQIDQLNVQACACPPGPVVVDIESWYSNSGIRYMLGGKDPMNRSLLYPGPLLFRQNVSGTGNTVLKGRIYDKTNSNLKGKILRLEFRVLPIR